MTSAKTELSLPHFTVVFQSDRASVHGDVPAKLVKFIHGAKKSLDVAIYDLKEQTVLAALKEASKSVKLRIGYDAGKPTVASNAHVDPKPAGTEAAIKAAGLEPYSTPIHVKGGRLMHAKFIARDGATVWTGSGNLTHGGLTLQDNNFLILESHQLAR